MFLVFVVLLLAISFAPESEAFTAGGGGNIPRGAKREYEVSSNRNISILQCLFYSRILVFRADKIRTKTRVNSTMKKSVMNEKHFNQTVCEVKKLQVVCLSNSRGYILISRPFKKKVCFTE